MKHWRSSLLAAFAVASGMDAAAAHFETFSHVEVRDEFLERGIFLPLADWEAKATTSALSKPDRMPRM